MAEYSDDEYGYDVYGQDRNAIVKKHLIKYFPAILKRKDKDGSNSFFAKFINAHEHALRRVDAGLDYIQRSHQIAHASGSDLDKIGSIFGELGKRRGRSDAEYRVYLKGLVQSFNGRGTKPGLKFAVAAAVNTETENIVVDEDFQNNEYGLRIEDPDVGFLSGVVNEVAQLADPSGVALASPPVVTWEGDDIEIEHTESKVIESSTGLGAGTLTMDGNSTLG